MVVEAHDPCIPSVAHTVSRFVTLLDHSATTVNVAEDYVTRTASSLPALHHAYDLLKSRGPGTHDCSRLDGDWLKQIHDLSMVPLLIDVEFLGPEANAASVYQDDSIARLSEELHISFEMDQIESGMDHPAETVISRALAQPSHANTLGWLRSTCLNSSDPSFASSVLRCLGRLDSPGTISWRASLVRDALALDDVEIRNAAAQAADSWADPELVEVLSLHRESERWLRSYVAEIISDLKKIHHVPGS